MGRCVMSTMAYTWSRAWGASILERFAEVTRAVASAVIQRLPKTGDARNMLCGAPCAVAANVAAKRRARAAHTKTSSCATSATTLLRTSLTQMSLSPFGATYTQIAEHAGPLSHEYLQKPNGILCHSRTVAFAEVLIRHGSAIEPHTWVGHGDARTSALTCT